MNLLCIDNRTDLYEWFELHHNDSDEFWIRVNRASAPFPGVIGYSDAVEVALCFGWIDSTLKRIDEGKAVQRFTHRRSGSNWCQRNLDRCRKLIKSGEMKQAGLDVLPEGFDVSQV